MTTANSDALIETGPGIYYVKPGRLCAIDQSHIDFLKHRAAGLPGKRARICAHPAVDNTLHEMIIVLTRGVYVRPHQHPGKSESSHVISGSADVVFFGSDGGIDECLRLSAAATFFNRIDTARFHTLLVRDDFFVFHETTKGPFVASETVFAPWAPSEDKPELVGAYLIELEIALRNRNSAISEKTTKDSRGRS